MKLSGGNYGGYEVINNTVVFGEDVVAFNLSNGFLNINGWLYNENGIFVGME